MAVKIIKHGRSTLDMVDQHSAAVLTKGFKMFIAFNIYGMVSHALY